MDWERGPPNIPSASPALTDSGRRRRRAACPGVRRRASLPAPHRVKAYSFPGTALFAVVLLVIVLRAKQPCISLPNPPRATRNPLGTYSSACGCIVTSYSKFGRRRRAHN